MTGEDHLHIIEKEKGAVQQLSFVENRTLMFYLRKNIYTNQIFSV